MTWWAIALPLMVAVAAVLVPGLAIGRLTALRGPTLWGLAPALSMTALAVLTLGYGVLHVPWNPLSVVIGFAVLIGGAWAARLVVQRAAGHRPVARAMVRAPRGGTRSLLAGTGLAFLLIGFRLAAAFGAPDHVSQTFDAIFHLNGVRYILTTGDIDPLTFSSISYRYDGQGAFYPNLWHALASFVTASSGGNIAVGANAVAIAIGGVVWPLSILFLVRALVGDRRLAMITAGIVASGFGAFPLLPLDFGVLYPNLLAIALVPAALGALVAALRRGRQPALRPLAAWVAFAAVLPGLALAQPNGLISVLVLGAPLYFVELWRWWNALRQRSAPRRDYLRGGAAFAGVAVVLVILFLVLRPPRAAAGWKPTLSLPAAVLDALVNAQMIVPAIALSVLVFAGIASAFVARRGRWVVASLGVLDLFYLAVASLPVGGWRFWVTGTWYSDIRRLIALFPVVEVPLAVLGVLWAGDLASAAWRRWRPGTPGRRAIRTVAVLAVAALVGGLAPQLGGSLAHEWRKAASNYRVTPESRLITPNALALLRRVPKEVPRDAIIAGNPWTGTSFVWALENRRAMMPDIYAYVSPAMALILRSLKHANTVPGVCAAVAETHVGYVLDFGDLGAFGVTTSTYPGVTDVSGSPVLTRIDGAGRSALYRITGC